MILDAYPNGLLTGKCGYRWKNEQSIPLTDDLFENDSFCMAGLRSRTLGIYENDTGKGIVCNVEGYPYTLIWSAPAKPVRFVCIEPWHSADVGVPLCKVLFLAGDRLHKLLVVFCHFVISS
mgnify:CR=1 FL=1